MSSDIFPDVVRIETSGMCNYECIHCSTKDLTRKRPLLSSSLFFSIIDQFDKMSFVPRVVVLYHGGEPLMNKNLSLFIRMLKAYGVRKTSITTNCSLLDARTSEALLLAGLDELKVSFDGSSPEENNKIRKNGDFYHAAGNLLLFLKLAKKFRLPLPLIEVSNVQIFTRAQLLEIMSEGNNRQLAIPQYLLDFFAEFESYLKFASFPARQWVGYKPSPLLKSECLPIEAPKNCPNAFETISVLSNGDVVPCCDDLNGDMVFGNVKDASIFDIWNDTRYVQFRDLLGRGIAPKFCKTCPKFNSTFLTY